MKEDTPAQDEVNFLNAEYKTYIEREKSTWLSENRIDSRDVYEVMSPEDQKKVH